jgi:hypothetical protein
LILFLLGALQAGASLIAPELSQQPQQSNAQLTDLTIQYRPGAAGSHYYYVGRAAEETNFTSLYLSRALLNQQWPDFGALGPGGSNRLFVMDMSAFAPTGEVVLLPMDGPCYRTGHTYRTTVSQFNSDYHPWNARAQSAQVLDPKQVRTNDYSSIVCAVCPPPSVSSPGASLAKFLLLTLASGAGLAWLIRQRMRESAED